MQESAEVFAGRIHVDKILLFVCLGRVDMILFR